MQGDRHQDQRRAVLLLGLVVAGPGQKAQGHEQGVGTPFLQRGPGSAEQVDQPGLEFVLLQGDEQLTTLQGVERVGAAQVFALTSFVDGLIARIVAVHEVRTRQQLERLAVGQQVLQGTSIRCLQLQGLLA